MPLRTLVEALTAAPDERPFVTMWTADDDFESASFGQFRRFARGFAAQIAALDVRRGDTVVLVMPQGISLMAAFAGAMTIGAVPTILAYPNFKVDPAKYCHGLEGVTANLKARIVMVDEAFPENLLQSIRANGARIVRRADRAIEADAAGFPGPSGSPDPSSIAFIQHSAGTTGLQKAVALSHAAVLRQLDHLAQVLRIGTEDRIYSWLPLYHDMGLIACFMLPLVYHLPVVMQSPDAWVIQPRTMLELIAQYRCTLAWVPNFTLQFLARRVRPEDREGLDLSSLRALVNCSEPIRAQSIDEFIAAYAPCGLRCSTVQSSYAMAENVFAVTQSDPGSATGPVRLWVDGERLKSAQIALPFNGGTNGSVCLVSSGRCIPENEVRIVSASGADLPEGAVGEILIRSDSLFDGYYNRRDLSEAAFASGWYRSGDLGLRWRGELYVTGRKKDLIIVAGKNIHPVDVEEIVCAHPAIHDGRAVAFGLFNPELGTEDIVVAAELNSDVDAADHAAIEKSVRAAVVAELGVAIRGLYLKPPRWVVKSTAGKAARSTTREKLLAEHPELDGTSRGLQP